MRLISKLFEMTAMTSIQVGLCMQMQIERCNCPKLLEKILMGMGLDI